MLALASAVILIAWAEYNRYRFRDKDRRGAHANVDRQDIARAFGSSDEIARSLVASKVAVLRMDDSAAPVGVSTL